MYKWSFSVCTVCHGRVNTVVKAKNKDEAIRKGFKWAEKKGYACTAMWDCRLLPTF